MILTPLPIISIDQQITQINLDEIGKKGAFHGAGADK